MTVRIVEPSSGTLISTLFESPDYRDAFEVALAPDGPGTVEEFATAYFLSQPSWLLALSLNTIGRSKIETQIGDASYQAGSSIGAWKVYERADNEIVFGDNMGFMEYRFGFHMSPDTPGICEAGTSVKYLWTRTGKYYFSLVKPMHVRFVRQSLGAV